MTDDARAGSAQGILVPALTPGQRTDLLSAGRDRTYAKGSSIFLRGDPGDAILVIQSGRVEVSITSLTGRKSVLNHMGPGEILGEIAALDGQTRSADAVAATEVQGVLIPRHAILNVLADDTSVSLAVIRELCAKVRNASEMFEVQVQGTAAPRLARCLLRIAEKWGAPDGDGATRIAQRFSQSDLGEFSGLARENVNRQFRLWEEDGVVQMDNRHIVLCDMDILEELAEL